MTDRLGDEKGSSPVSGKGWRAWPSRLGGDELPEILFFAVISVLYLLFWRPIQGVMRIRNTERFKHLAQLNLDALCRELLDGRDFDSLVDVEQRAREGELREVANHISEQCALGALDRGYPQLVEIFYRKRF